MLLKDIGFFFRNEIIKIYKRFHDMRPISTVKNTKNDYKIKFANLQIVYIVYIA